MINKSVKLSIVIVNYEVKKEILECISSIYTSKPNIEYEIIVIDNSKSDELGKTLHIKFPKVTYYKSARNLGYGAGNNMGAEIAKGEFLLFLNPDTKIVGNTIDSLHSSMLKLKGVGIVAPLLLDGSGKEYPLQGTTTLTPLKAILNLSFFSKLLAKIGFHQDYYVKSWDQNGYRHVDVCPGTAFMIRKELFERIHLFDEHFFLYFEESDLCKRVRELGFKIFIDSKAQLIHHWGRSTAGIDNKEKIFEQSRFLYFRKHFGLLKALATELVLRINKYSLALVGILLYAFTLLIYNLGQNMAFIGDQGWFYLSARDNLIGHTIPLIGVASSHPWLHQGPYWTYILMILFKLFNFNPIVPAYFSIFVGLITIVFVYLLGKTMFSKGIGLISAILYATSPLVITNMRMPYHTVFIPLLTTLLIMSIYNWIKGRRIFFPLVILFLGLLYNFELATFTLWFVVLAILLIGLFFKKSWAKEVFSRQTIFLSLLAFILSMLPILIYDFSHQFIQTLGFLAWIGYRVMVVFGYPSLHPEIASPSLSNALLFAQKNLQSLIFSGNMFIAITIFIAAFIYLLNKVMRRILQKQFEQNFILLFFILATTLLGFFATKTISAAYLPIFFPTIFITVALMLNGLFKINYGYILVLIIVISLSLINNYLLISSNYFIPSGIAMTKRVEAAKQIIKEANGKEYNLLGDGEESKFASFTMNYEYLLWYMGHAPSKTLQNTKIVVSERSNAIQIRKLKND